MTGVRGEDKGKRRAKVEAKAVGVKRNRSGRATRYKILSAAEKVFATKGINGASLREIMILADVNIAAVNYYFGNKADLLRAVIERRSDEINEKRLVLLKAACLADGAPSIEAWIHAFISPFLEAQRSTDPGWQDFMRVLNWMSAARDISGTNIVRESFQRLRTEFLDALRLALPQLNDHDLYWRYRCVLSVTRWVVASGRQRSVPTSTGSIGPNDDLDKDEMMRNVSAFLLAGLMAPSLSVREQPRSEAAE